MKLTIDSEQDRAEFRIATNLMAWPLTICAVDEKLRQWLKYGHEFKTPDEALERVRELLYEAMSDRGISMDDIP